MTTVVALGLKWLSVWAVLLLFSFSFGPNPGQAAAMAAVVAVASWLADKALPFRLQGLTRWAIDSGLAAVAIYLSQFLWPGRGISFYTSLWAGAVVGSIEIPLHYVLRGRLWARATDDNRDGIR